MHNIIDLFSQIGGRDCKGKTFVGVADIGPCHCLCRSGVLYRIRIIHRANINLIILIGLGNQRHRCRISVNGKAAFPLKMQGRIINNRKSGAIELINTVG